MKFNYKGRIVEASSREAAIRKIAGCTFRRASAASENDYVEITDVYVAVCEPDETGHWREVPSHGNEKTGHANVYLRKKFRGFKELIDFFDGHATKGRGEDTYWNYYTADLTDKTALIRVEVDQDEKGRNIGHTGAYMLSYEIRVCVPECQGVEDMKSRLEAADIITATDDAS